MFRDSLKQNTNKLLVALCFSISSLALISCEANYPQHQELPVSIDSDYVKPSSAKEIVKIFDDLDIKLADVRSDQARLPRIYFECLPNDMHKQLPHRVRQEMFILSVLPLILKVNEEIEADRNYLLSLKNSYTHLSAHQEENVKKLAEKYKLQTTDIDQMLIHIDIIPPSLALAQTCLETGWGSSAAARIKKSLFGMTVSRTVKSYDSLAECTWKYMRNLNYNPAYMEFRALRAKMRHENKPFDSVKLSASLTKYCEFTRSYLRDLKLILTDYNLSDFDQVCLAEPEVNRAVGY